MRFKKRMVILEKLRIFLFFFEVGVFLVWPAISEINALINLRAYFKKNPRILATSAVLTVLLLWFALPMPRTEVFPAITIPAQEQILWAPYDGIVVAAGAPKLPRELLEQLGPEGRLVIPIGSLHEQELWKVTRTEKGYSIRTMGACRFVPLIGKGAWPEQGP